MTTPEASRPDLASDPPPLLTQSWLRDNSAALTRLQLDGELCVYCGSEPRIMVPVGRVGRRLLFACQPACEPARGPDRP
jgi:hypothetical protein